MRGEFQRLLTKKEALADKIRLVTEKLSLKALQTEKKLMLLQEQIVWMQVIWGSE